MRSLKFELYNSGDAGLFNVLMSLELGIGLSVLSDRPLLFEAPKFPIFNSERRQTIFDLFDKEKYRCKALSIVNNLIRRYRRFASVHIRRNDFVSTHQRSCDVTIDEILYNIECHVPRNYFLDCGLRRMSGCARRHADQHRICLRSLAW
jgi:hypothetical protein